MRRCVKAMTIMLLALLAACKGDDDVPAAMQDVAVPPVVVSRELTAIDSLMWQQPDSAWAMLMSWFGDRDGTAWLDTVNETTDIHYASLLLAESLYKQGYAQTNREDLLCAVAFFDSLTIAQNASLAFLAARAHYINGVGYYESDSVALACEEYIKALETMEANFSESELVGSKARFMALAYTRLTELFSGYYFHEQAIGLGQLALYYYEKHDAEAWHKAWILNEIGTHLVILEEFDSARNCLKKADSLISDSQSVLHRDIATHRAYLEYVGGKAVNDYLATLHELLVQSESEGERMARYLAIGATYYKEKQYDSAKVYLDGVFREANSVGAKKQAAEWMVEICQSQGDDTAIMEYVAFLAPFATQGENQGVLRSRLAGLYDGFRQREMQRKQDLGGKIDVILHRYTGNYKFASYGSITGYAATPDAYRILPCSTMDGMNRGYVWKADKKSQTFRR